jgi:hypothetical protein
MYPHIYTIHLLQQQQTKKHEHDGLKICFALYYNLNYILDKLFHLFLVIDYHAKLK